MMDWLDLLAVQGNLKSSPTPQFKSINSLMLSFIVQLSHPYMTTGKIIALTRWTFVGKVMSLLFNMLSRLVEGRRRRGQQRMRCLDGITDLMDMSLSKLRELVMGQGSLACCSPWGRKESDTIEQLN